MGLQQMQLRHLCEKEQKEVLDGVIKLSEINANCRYEIWNKAGHNIPPVFGKRFNELICSVVSTIKSQD